jgi:hypothetical protein
MSVRNASVGGAVGLGGIAAGHGSTWVTATVVLVVLAGALGAAELGATAPLRRLWKLARRAA